MTSVDVIVPCYRYGHYLRQCVQSVLNQEGVLARILILDDASPDETPDVGNELARADSRVTFVRHKSNRGHIATYNEGIEWASGTYLLLLSADDYLLPGALLRSANVLDNNAEVGFVFGNVLAMYETGKTVPVRPLARTKRPWAVIRGLDFVDFCGATNIVSTPSAVVRTELQKRLGGYRPELPHSGDMEMWLRLASQGSVGFVDAFQAVYRRHSTNMSMAYAASSSLPDIQQRRAALDCFFQASGNMLPQLSLLRLRLYESLSRQAIGFASEAFNRGDFASLEQLLEFAATLSPKVRGSWPWNKLAMKRLLGPRVWGVIQGVLGPLPATNG